MLAPGLPERNALALDVEMLICGLRLRSVKQLFEEA